MSSDEQAAVQADAIATGVENGMTAGADKLKRARIGFYDRRALIIYLVLIVILGGGATAFQYEINKTNDQQSQIRHQQDQLRTQQAQAAKQQAQIIAAQRAAVVVCQATDTANAGTRLVLTQLATNIKNSTAQTADQKAAALAVYAHLELGFPNIDCSHLAGQ